MQVERYNELLQMELIDTLWNVNVSVSTIFPSTSSELIDTLWNVNSFTQQTMGRNT